LLHSNFAETDVFTISAQSFALLQKYLNYRFSGPKKIFFNAISFNNNQNVANNDNF